MDRRLRFIASAVWVVFTSAVIVIAGESLWEPPSVGASLAVRGASDSSDFQIALRWVQPIVGQAIVEDALLRQRHPGLFTGAAGSANRISPDVHRTDSSKTLPRTSQWVMGRVIVSLTRQELRDNTPAEGPFQEKVNQRIIIVARAVGAKLDRSVNVDSWAVLDRSV
ncbi:MAG TPA: hypothetical protein VNK46_16465 [Nitrospiraceae bacterium]|nr:hypothetical protein [Nitrospiraceae bacterium]